jgi:WD40 repeat protein
MALSLSEASVPETGPGQEDERPKFPYPGLRPFKMSEAEIFYGRNAQKDSVLERLNEHRMVFITGPSGCGKSSLIKAGVIPALRAGLLTRAGYRWNTTEMRPGQQPLANLARALEDALHAGASRSKLSGNGFRSFLEHEEEGLWAVMDEAESLRSGGGHVLLLLVDQFEEIFGPQIKYLSEVDAFVRLLVTQYARPHPSLFVVFTIRSDYVGQCANFPGLSDAINHCQYLTPALTARELREAIVRPAEDYGAHVSEELVDDILTDMRLGTRYDADNLPLMQHALLFLWRKAIKSELLGKTGPDATGTVTLDVSEYRKLGGMRAILCRHADAIFVEAAGLDGERAAIAQALFRRLSERDREGRYRRSPASFDEIKEVAACSKAELEQVIDPFAHEEASFLEIRHHNLLDISHEALIRTWDKARAWTDQEAEDIQTFRELLRKAEAWRDGRESPGLLNSPPDLDVCERWWRQSKPSVTWAKRYFAQEEGGVAGAAAAVELAARYLHASREADERVKRKYRNQRLVLGALALLLLCSFLGSFLLIKNEEAKSALMWAKWAEEDFQRQRAKTIAVKAEDALKNEGPKKAILLAIEAQRQKLPTLPETERVIFNSLGKPMENRIISGLARLLGAAFSPEWKAIVAMDSNSLRFWNPNDGALIGTYPLKGLPIAPALGRIQWSPKGNWIALGSQGKILLLAPCSHQELKALFPSCAGKDQDRERLIGDQGHRASMAKFSNDERWMVTSALGGPLMRWDIAESNAVAGKSLGATPPMPNAFAISPDQKSVAAGFLNGEIQLIDQNSGKVQATLGPLDDHATVIALSFNPRDPNMLVAAEVSGNIYVWNVDNKEPRLLKRTKGPAWQVAFSDNGEFITAAGDWVIRRWETRKLEDSPLPFAGHSGDVNWIGFSPDGTRMASASISDHTIRIWNFQPPLYEKVEATPEDGRSSGLRSGKAQPDDCAAGIELPPGFDRVAACVESETGRRVVASSGGAFALFNVRDRWEEPIAVWRGPDDVASLELEHDPDRIVALSSSGSRVSWPFFKDIESLMRFAADQLPFEGRDRVSLPDEDRCGIAPPETPCKAEQEKAHK